MSLPHDAGSSSGGLGAQASSPTPTKAPEQLGGPKHFSIDLSLELERQLELEGSSPPTTPSASESSHSRSYPHAQPNPNTLDPQILVHIVTGLRKTVEDLTKERDDLVNLFESSTTREATLQDTLALMTEKATDYEEELSAAKKKIKEDEEAISLLRNKVEESRWVSWLVDLMLPCVDFCVLDEESCGCKLRVDVRVLSPAHSIYLDPQYPE